MENVTIEFYGKPIETVDDVLDLVAEGTPREFDDILRAFVNRAVANEREACAKIAEEFAERVGNRDGVDIAAVIRARK